MAEAVTAGGQLAVLKIALPPGIDGVAPFKQELQALQDAGGDQLQRLPAGAAKAEWLARFITDAWQDLGEPCSERAARRAIDYAAERASRADPRYTGLVHGDAHPPTC